MSPSTPPNSSSEPVPAAASLEALSARLAGEFGVGADTLALVSQVYREVGERAPDLFVPAPGALGTAFAAADPAAMRLALGEWALDAEHEPLERMRRDCQRLLAALTRGALRLHAQDQQRCGEVLLALQRFSFLQLALLASLVARGQDEGGVVRTLPTPEYAAFMELLRAAIDSHRQQGRSLALLLLQVGKTEQIDRQLGLQKGEAFMLRLTRRMREGVLRRQDQLGRVSRDQFACLLPGIAGEGVALLAANKILGALQAPIPLGDVSYDTDAVIGIAVYPGHGAHAQDLVRNAKLAARAARGSADRTAVYDPAQGEVEARQMHLESRLRLALEQGALDLVFEPQLDAGTGRIGGLECLLRWDDPELGPVSEAEAMQTAETAGIARELSSWILNNALRHSAQFTRAGLECMLALRLAPSSLIQPDLPEFIERALRIWGVPPGRLVIGLDASAITGSPEPVRSALLRIKDTGVVLGIEGFATGVSCLGDLVQLPFDELKLGAPLVSDMRHSQTRARLAKALVRLAHDLGLRVTAQGVNDGQTAAALLGLGCARVQGTHVAEALGAEAILQFAQSGDGLAGLRQRDP